jgi:hypothetical protein
VPVLAFLIVGLGAAYVRLRWQRSPRAYRAMIAPAGCSFVPGTLAGVWIARFVGAPKRVQGTRLEAPVSRNIPAPSACVSTFVNPLDSLSAKVTSIGDGDTAAGAVAIDIAHGFLAEYPLAILPLCAFVDILLMPRASLPLGRTYGNSSGDLDWADAAVNKAVRMKRRELILPRARRQRPIGSANIQKGCR